jgi:hypothetical protein
VARALLPANLSLSDLNGVSFILISRENASHALLVFGLACGYRCSSLAACIGIPNRLSSSELMKKTSALILLIFFSLSLPAAEPKWDPLPLALSNNVLAAAKVDKHLYLYSFMGIGDKRRSPTAPSP